MTNIKRQETLFKVIFCLGLKFSRNVFPDNFFFLQNECDSLTHVFGVFWGASGDVSPQSEGIFGFSQECGRDL